MTRVTWEYFSSLNNLRAEPIIWEAFKEDFPIALAIVIEADEACDLIIKWNDHLAVQIDNSFESKWIYHHSHCCCSFGSWFGFHVFPKEEDDEEGRIVCDCTLINNEASHHFDSSRRRIRSDISHNFPYSTHLVQLKRCHRPKSECFIQIFPSHLSNNIQFSFIYYFVLLPSSCCCWCCRCRSHVCMINGIRDFDHVGNFYVSWISKKAKKNSRFIIAQKRNLRASQRRILMLPSTQTAAEAAAKLQKDCSLKEFSVIHKRRWQLHWCNENILAHPDDKSNERTNERQVQSKENWIIWRCQMNFDWILFAVHWLSIESPRLRFPLWK